jgi:pyruvate kinase
MIARGDLAVEIGFERMGEIQEEILWICEAAHVPVVWATQVLETLNKTGIATRSEITDAAHAALAECVMVNKGNHTIEVIETLRDILLRSSGHQIKKRFTFRPLSIAERFMKE